MATPCKLKILILNPNCSTTMTEGMVSAISNMTSCENLEFAAYTAPGFAPNSIDDDEGIRVSAHAVLADITAGNLDLSNYDSILVACFSVHTLVELLSALTTVPVTGIFEASILTSLSLTTPIECWGIVTTGAFWEAHLDDGVRAFLGQALEHTNGRFAGTYSSLLSAGDFLRASPEQIEAKLKNATRWMLHTANIRCIVMGCAGMAGLEGIIRSAAIEVYGEQRGKSVYIIDSVRAGVLQLQQTMLSRREFEKSSSIA